MNLKKILCLFTIFSLFGLSFSSIFSNEDTESENEEEKEKSNKLELGNLCFDNNLIFLEENNVVTIRGAVGPRSTNKFIQDIHNIESDDIYIYLSTPGGSVIHGYQIIQIIDALAQSGKNIHCIADYAYSMGFAIMQSCPSRYAMIGSSIMQHQMSFGIEGQMENNKNRIKFIEEIERQMDDRQSKKLGLEIDDFKEKTLSDWWLFGEEICENNAADKMANVICDRSLVEQIYTEEYDLIFFGKLYVDFSKCPLISDPLKVYFEDEAKNKEEITETEKLNKIFTEIKASKETFLH